jgi:hypothetical protein
MARTSKSLQLFTVRWDGGYVGTYKTFTAEQAIRRAQDDQLAYISVFRRQGKGLVLKNCTATVEPTPDWMT